MNKGMRVVLRLMLLALVGLANRAETQSIPSLVNYQGKLENSDGTPVATADYSLEFSVFSSAEGGTVIWGPQIFNGQNGQGYGPLIPVVRGFFNVMLGEFDFAGRALGQAFEGGESWVEIRISGREPFRPRQRIASSPYSFMAERAARADFADEAGSVRNAPPLPFFTDDAGNIGIGVELPQASLDVNGRVQATEFIGDGSQLRNIPKRDVTTKSLSIFVDDEGDDEGLGTIEAPFRTINRALELVPRFIEHQVTINLLPGEYNQLTEIFNRTSHVDSGGLTIQSFRPEGQVLFDPSSVLFSGRDNYFRIGNTTGLSILGVTFERSTGNDVAVYLIQRCNVALEQCQFNSARGVYARMFSHLYLRDVVFNGLDDGNVPAGTWAVIADFYSFVSFLDGGGASNEQVSNTIDGYNEGIKLRHYSSALNSPAPTIRNTAIPLVEQGNSHSLSPP